MTDNDESIRVIIDRDKCVGHGRCYTLAPGVFTDDDEGFPEFVDGDVPATSDLREQARLGAQACPEGAIFISSLGTD